MSITLDLPRTLKTLSRGELLDLAIVKSDNFAAYTLCANYYPGGIDRCIAEMNHEALRVWYVFNTLY
jgi:D-alanyl-D-alanine carboxypeptidase